MKRMSLILAGLCLAFVMCAVIATAKTDFSGTWVMDKAKSEGLTQGMEQTMLVKQGGDTLEVETKIITDQGD